MNLREVREAAECMRDTGYMGTGYAPWQAVWLHEEETQMSQEMTPKPGTDFCPNCSETIANIRMRNSLIAELKRIIVLKGLKEKYQEPDCCDPMEAGLPYWSETNEGKELERLMKLHFPDVKQ